MSQLINEAFKELKGLDLDEEMFSFDKKGALALDKFLDQEVTPVLDVMDPLAVDEDSLQPSYEGDVICRCCVCRQLIYKKPEDIIIDPETQRANVEEECPHCCSTGGFEIIGQVTPYIDKDELKVTVDDDEVEVEDKEEVTESCKSRKAVKEGLKHGYSIHDTKKNMYVAGLGRYPTMVISIHSAIHFDTKEEAEEVLNDIITRAEYPIPEGRYVIEEYDADKLSRALYSDRDDERFEDEDEEITESVEKLQESDWGDRYFKWSKVTTAKLDKIIEAGLWDDLYADIRENGVTRFSRDGGWSVTAHAYGGPNDTEVKEISNLVYATINKYYRKALETGESLNEDTDDEIIDDYIGLRGKFRGYTTDEAKQLYDTWDDKLKRPTAPEEIEDYEELRDTYGKTVEVIDCSIFIKGNSPIDTFDKSYWEVEFNDGTSMSGVSGYNIDLYDFFNGKLEFRESFNEDFDDVTGRVEDILDKYNIRLISERDYGNGKRYTFKVDSDTFKAFSKEVKNFEADKMLSYDWVQLSNGPYEITIVPYGEIEEDEEDFIIDENGNEITSKEEARKWLRKQTAKYSNTHAFPSSIKKILNALIDKFGNTYFWFKEGINEDTIKTKKGWVNKGKEGTHGTFKTKKAADAQRKAMFAQGYRGESLKEDLDDEEDPSVNSSEEWGIWMDGGSIGESRGLIVRNLTKEEAQRRAKGRNKLLSPGEKKYYMIHYRAVRVTPAIIERTKKMNLGRDESLNEDVNSSMVGKNITWDSRGIFGKVISENDPLTDKTTIEETSTGKEIYINTRLLKKAIETGKAVLKEDLDEPIDVDTIKIKVKEEDITFFDEETGDIVVNEDNFKGTDVETGDYVEVTFEDEEGSYDKSPVVLFKVIRKTEDGRHLEYIEVKKGGIKEDLKEDFQKATVETGESILSMESDDSGKVTVTSEPRKIDEGGEEMVGPISDEVVAEIEENNPEATEEETAEEESASDEESTEDGEEESEGAEEAEIEVNEFEESYFDDLSRKYLKEVYNNVKDYTTVKGTLDNNKIKLEGIITFNSGKKAKTTFLFEGASVTKKGKIRFIGENLQFANKRNAFTLTGTVKDKKLFAESLNYNYVAKDAFTGKSMRKYNTVKR